MYWQQCCGSGMFIPDPTFFHLRSRIRIVSIPDPGSASKNLSVLTQKNGFYTLKNIIRVFHPRSRIRILTFYPSRIPDPGVKKAPDPGSRIRNTVWQGLLIQLLVFVCIQPNILIRVETRMASQASILVTPCLHLYDMRLMREKGAYHKKCRLPTMTVAQVKQFL